MKNVIIERLTFKYNVEGMVDLNHVFKQGNKVRAKLNLPYMDMIDWVKSPKTQGYLAYDLDSATYVTDDKDHMLVTERLALIAAHALYKNWSSSPYFLN